MDRLKLSRIDEELESSEVASLCFLCQDVVNRKRLEGIRDAKKLFLRLEEKGLLENDLFLYNLLQTIRRTDLLNLLETDSRRLEETDASPMLSEYRVTLYKVYEDMTQENLDKMKFLLSSQLGRRQTETCNTALDVFAEMEKSGLLSNTNLQELHTVLLQLDQQLASMIQRYMERVTPPPQARVSHVSMDYQRVNNVSISESQARCREMTVCSDAEPNTESSSLPDHADYYALKNIPRGLCVVINNEDFQGSELKSRKGSQEDVEALSTVFTLLGFTVSVHNNLTAEAMRQELRMLGSRDFLDEDALVVCVLSHGAMECVFGADEQKVSLKELTRPFTSRGAPTLAGKPKLFFIQACQGSDYQRGAQPCPLRPKQEEAVRESLEEDAGSVSGETVPWEADMLLGMATVPECKSFRNINTGSIYIQELCRQLRRSAESSEKEDVLTVLTRVNREVGKGEYLNYKQMPQPKYTLTKKLVLKFV
ncbi:caspase-8-like [Anarrhichthys ocellatus]|uniref:caspase-8-like n=1 Tax=Anarrhichthys ocellatus TaxID=433405 RepID=UPI0012EDBA06|nr:caspase-8-like [Anarrhichthys ocellatus]XP_031711149.1 caspase-8-like [Anarrhichthys ocellatus]